MTNGDILRAHAERLGIPLRSLEQVRVAILEAKAKGSDATFARLMLAQGRLTDEARAWLSGEYPQ